MMMGVSQTSGGLLYNLLSHPVFFLLCLFRGWSRLMFLLKLDQEAKAFFGTILYDKRSMCAQF